MKKQILIIVLTILMSGGSYFAYAQVVEDFKPSSVNQPGETIPAGEFRRAGSRSDFSTRGQTCTT
jgi:hypothetical protein